MNPEPDTQLSADNELKKILRTRIEGFNPYRKARLVQQKANIAYVVGRQNIRIVGGQIQPIKEVEAFYYPPHNKILPAVRNDIAVATKTNPKWEVVPAGTDEDDKATAKAGDKILEYLWRINRFSQQRGSVVLWYDLDGIAWAKVYWNPHYKFVGRNPGPEEDGHNPELPPGAPLFQGEVVREHVPNNELIFDHRIKNPHKFKWIIHAKTITIGEVRARFGDAILRKISTSAIHTKETQKESYEAEIMSDFQVLSEDVAPPTDIKTDKLLEDDKFINYYEFWHIVDNTMPQGSYAVALGDPNSLTIVVNQPYPIEQYPHGELPFIAYAPLSLDGITVGAVAIISQARPLQRHYNQLCAIIKENIDVMGSGIFLVPKGTNLDFKKIDFGTGNVVEYDNTASISPPRREPGTPLIGGIFIHLENLRRDLDELFAFHEPSKGMMPEGGPRSAIGLQTLQEADATQLSPIIKALDVADEKAAYQMLSVALANYRERLIEVIGKDNQWTLHKIDPKQLNGKVNVIIRTGSSLPMNKALEQEKAFMLWQSGILGNPQLPEVRNPVLKIMDLGGFENILQSNSKQINRAELEFINAEKLALMAPPLTEGALSVKAGRLVPANESVDSVLQQFLYVPAITPIDDDYVHLQEHGNFYLDKFDEYMGSGNPILMALGWAMQDHILQHQQRIAEQQMQMMMMQNPKGFLDGSKEKTKND